MTSDHPYFMESSALLEVRRSVDEAYRSLGEVGFFSAIAYVRNAQIQLAKVAEDMAGVAIREAAYQHNIRCKSKNA